MAKYKIECEQCLGCTCYGGSVTTNGESTVELSDEEVAVLVQLMREKNTADVEELDLETSHPDLYEKLDEAYSDMARKAETVYWLRNGIYEPDAYEYDVDELMAYCEENCGYKPEEYDCRDGEDYDEDDEDELRCRKEEAFKEWLIDYVEGLDDEEVTEFAYDHLNAEVDVFDVDYKVAIPEDIIKMAGIE